MAEFTRALISVYDKTGIFEFARGLAKLGFEIISTGGTAKFLQEKGIKVTKIAELTKFPEMLEGRVKTLHPLIHAAILAKHNKKHLSELEKQGIKPIDLVVVNLYPFEKKLKAKAKHEELIENIDIGGPTLIRSAAKNYENVLVLTNPNQYSEILKELEKGKVKQETRENLAREAFNYVAHYDTIIDNYFQQKQKDFPQNLNLTFTKSQDLRYGENPHQQAALYLDSINSGIASAEQLHGKQLSFNNMLDLNHAWDAVQEFEKPSAVIVKHANPCGVASANSILQAYKHAHECDPISSFGGIIALNKKLDKETASEIIKSFVEAVIASDYEKGALEVLKKKKNLRIMKFAKKESRELDFKKISGGLLVQTPNNKNPAKSELKTVSKKKPSKEELNSLLFAWKVLKHVKSNSIVLSKGTKTIGIGAGQTSRVDAVRLAVEKSKGKSKGSVLASDAFFPFSDGIDEAAKGGITAIIQPGGSIRDEEVIKAVNEHKMAMVLTGIRCLEH